MARFARGQPHAPILLRNTAALIVAAASAGNARIHVVDQAVQASRRPLAIERSRSAVVFISPNNRSTVPLRLAPQIHLVGQAVQRAALLETRTERRHHVVFISPNDRSTVPPRLPPPPKVVGQAVARAAQQSVHAEDRMVMYVRPSRTSLVPNRITPQVLVVSQAASAPSASRHPARDADVTFLRNPAAPAVVATATAPPIHIVSLASLSASSARHPSRLPDGVQLRNPALPISAPPPRVILAPAPRRPRVDVLYLRPSVSSLVPDRLAPQVHVVPLVAVTAARRPSKAATLYLRPSVASLVPSRLAPQTHVVSLAGLAVRHPGWEADVQYLRAPLLTPGAPQPHVVTVASSQAARHPSRDANITMLRPASGVGIAAVATGSPIHISGVAVRTSATHPARDADITLARGAQPPPPPSTVLPPQPHVVLAPPRRRPKAQVFSLRNPAAQPVSGTVYLDIENDGISITAPKYGGACNRPTVAWQWNGSLWTSVASNIDRCQHTVFSNGSFIANTRLAGEPRRTNSALFSSAMDTSANWGDAASFTIAPVASSIAGQTAYQHTGQNIGSAGRYQAIGTFVSGQMDVAYIMIESGTATQTSIGVFDNTVGQFLARIQLTWNGLVVSTVSGSPAASGVIYHGIGPNGGTLVTLWLATVGTASGTGAAGNSRLIYFYPSGVPANTLSVVMHHAQMEAAVLGNQCPFPTTPIVTTNVAGTRFQEFITVPLPLGAQPAQPLTIYSNIVDQGRSLINGLLGRLWGFTNFATASPFLIHETVTPGVEIFGIQPVATFTDAFASTSQTFGNQLELRDIVFNTGALQFGYAINGGSETMSAQTAPPAAGIVVPWAADAGVQQVYIGTFGASSGGGSAFVRFILAAGAPSLNQLRLTGVPGAVPKVLLQPRHRALPRTATLHSRTIQPPIVYSMVGTPTAIGSGAIVATRLDPAPTAHDLTPPALAPPLDLAASAHDLTPPILVTLARLP
jgi:hypothetical protein